MKRILIAEDEDVIRDFIVINLKRAGYEVVDVPDGEQALQVFEQSGGDFDVVVLDTTIDAPFISQVESKKEGVKFFRVDANLSEALKDESLAEDVEQTEKAEKLFKDALHNDQLKVRLESLKDPKVSAMLEVSEESRRMQDMMRMYGGMGMMPSANDETLVLNAASPVVQKLLASENEELSKTIAVQLYDLARISSRPLEAGELTAFIQRSQDLMQDLL